MKALEQGPLPDAQIAARAPWAVDENSSRGRRIAEPAPAWRDEFQRDRDRIIHCSAFRRLEYKTQVFVNHEGDMFRTRLTHSLEVAQIARAVARALGANEDLTEAIALAHDLGHTPFGHAGQAALHQCMRPHGGFEHNLHSLRVVDHLERRYEAFDGLNLTYETREGIVKHCPTERIAELGELGQRFARGEQPGVEAQIANIADEIAYNHHDIDDGLRSGILTLQTLREHELLASCLTSHQRTQRDAGDRRDIYTAIRAMLGLFVNDLIENSQARLADDDYRSSDDVRRAAAPVVDFSAPIRAQHLSLKRLLHKHLYCDPRVLTFTRAAQRTIEDLFAYCASHPQAWQQAVGRDGEAMTTPSGDPYRHIADYIAGMTDRFAIAAQRRLIGIERWPQHVDGTGQH